MKSNGSQSPCVEELAAVSQRLRDIVSECSPALNGRVRTLTERRGNSVFTQTIVSFRVFDDSPVTEAETTSAASPAED